HPDYPLLVPAQTWWLSGEQFHAKLGQAGGFLYFLDLLVLFYHEARRRFPRSLALAGTAVMVSWPALLKHSASGFADVPLAVYAFAVLLTLLHGDLRLAAVL